MIDGITTRVVEDRLYRNGFLGERTSDYYAQDRCGNVWYFGEDTAELNRRDKITSRSGTFHAGIQDAQPGVFLQAHPASLCAIQELPDRQRAVLIFRDVLGWTAPEVAELLESTVASVNSALQRARATIEQHLPETTRPAADPTERELLNRYVAAFEHADMDGLVALLREDARLRMPPQPPVSGGLQIARFLLETIAQGDLTRIRHTPTWANGRPAFTVPA